MPSIEEPPPLAARSYSDVGLYEQARAAARAKDQADAEMYRLIKDTHQKMGDLIARIEDPKIVEQEVAECKREIGEQLLKILDAEYGGGSLNAYGVMNSILTKIELLAHRLKKGED